LHLEEQLAFALKHGQREPYLDFGSQNELSSSGFEFFPHEHTDVA